jgi:chromatin segregation and condensation protein Rec8/ScpA/Scc1 (kleisin family)
MQQESNQPNTESIIRTIVLGADWEEALTAIVVEQGLDPLNLDITKLASAFMIYLNRLKSFDFRTPARFILIAAILLNMKCEALLQKEEERLDKLTAAAAAQLNLAAPLLTPPVTRQAARPVALTDLIAALNKAFEIKRKKEPFLTMHGKHIPIELPKHAVDIENSIKEIYERIRRKGIIKFSDLVPVWRRAEIIASFIPLLYLANRGKVVCEQKELFKEITIKLK